MQNHILHCTQIVEHECNMVNMKDTNSNVHIDLIVNTNFDVHTILNFNTNLDIDIKLDPQTNHKINPDMWTLFFDGSKSNEGTGIGCILKDPKGKRF
jgi:hypothetical protein